MTPPADKTTERTPYEAPRLYKINLRPEKPILQACSSNAPSVETGSCAPDIPGGTCELAGKL